jgi:uncharacterized protein YukE
MPDAYDADFAALDRRVTALEECLEQLRAEVAALLNSVAALHAEVSSNSNRGFLNRGLG